MVTREADIGLSSWSLESPAVPILLLWQHCCVSGFGEDFIYLHNPLPLLYISSVICPAPWCGLSIQTTWHLQWHIWPIALNISIVYCFRSLWKIFIFKNTLCENRHVYVLFTGFVEWDGKVGQPQIRLHFQCLKTTSLEWCNFDFRKASPNPLPWGSWHGSSSSYISIAAELIHGTRRSNVVVWKFPWDFYKALSSLMKRWCLMFCHSPHPTILRMC